MRMARLRLMCRDGGERLSPGQALALTALTARTRDGARGGFTLMELMVAVAILVFIILGVNLVFQGAANAVGTSQSVMAAMGSERALSGLIDHDLSAIDKNCFLVI